LLAGFSGTYALESDIGESKVVRRTDHVFSLPSIALLAKLLTGKLNLRHGQSPGQGHSCKSQVAIIFRVQDNERAPSACCYTSKCNTSSDWVEALLVSKYRGCEGSFNNIFSRFKKSSIFLSDAVCRFKIAQAPKDNMEFPRGDPPNVKRDWYK
jgi:hypothetical protein